MDSPAGQFFIKNIMPQQRPFTPEQDNIIKHLYEDLKIKKWGIIAKTMTEDYKMPRNAKQCRDRYKLFIDPNMQSEWTREEQRFLYDLHNQTGNKWALIATNFPGKTDNCVKNHFYSKLRKSLRHLNKIIKTHFKRQFRELKIGAIYKIIEGFEEQFKEKPIVPLEVSKYCANLKDALLSYAGDEMDEEMLGDFRKEKNLIVSIIQFSRNYRKKSKKEKREALQGVELFKPVRKIEEADEDSSQYSQIDNDSSSSNNNDNDMKSEKEEIRKSPVYVIVEDEGLRESNKSKGEGFEDIVVSEYKSDDHNNPKFPDFLHGSGSIDRLNFPFNFMRGESSFRSYRSHGSHSMTSETQKMDMFGDNLRLSETLRGLNGGEMDEQRDENLFRSQKEPVQKNRQIS